MLLFRKILEIPLNSENILIEARFFSFKVTRQSEMVQWSANSEMRAVFVWQKFMLQFIAFLSIR